MKSNNDKIDILSEGSTEITNSTEYAICPTCKNRYKKKTFYVHDQTKCQYFPIKLKKSKGKFICQYGCQAFNNRLEIFKHLLDEHCTQLEKQGIQKHKLSFEIDWQVKRLEMRKYRNTLRKRIKVLQSRLREKDFEKSKIKETTVNATD